MKSNSKPDCFKSFEELGSLVKSGKFPFAAPSSRNPAKSKDSGSTPAPITRQPVKSDDYNDQRIFLEAMAGVRPMESRNRQEAVPPDCNQKGKPEDPDAETFQKLTNLVDKGDGFVVALTPEYLEGLGYRVHPTVAERLHRGDFPIQDHIDLHGYGVAEAKIALDSFLEQSLATHKCAVLIVHGRGLSSPGAPVLKEKVREWLTSGRWRKWIAAFTSAGKFDGGAGATYVLLRQRPAQGRFRFHENR